MTAEELYAKYPYPKDLDHLQEQTDKAREEAQKYANDTDVLQTIFNSIDLTTLSHTDSANSVRRFVGRVNSFSEEFPQLKNVGGICVYSVFAPILKASLSAKGVHKAVVAACFPSSQAFADIKVAEVRKAVSAGATEIDIVISVGEFLEGNHDFVLGELRQLREASAGARLKVILETGALRSHEEIWQASLLAIEAGADFIKTSTGKNCGGATPEAVYVMCRAIGETQTKVGIKPAGGVSSPEEALVYYQIVNSLLGREWTEDNTRFRIGASRLANTLLDKILTLSNKPTVGKYF